MNLDNPTLLFDFQVNLMLSNLTMTIRDGLGFRGVRWDEADPETLDGLKVLDEAISNLNRITEKHLRDRK